jgi:hypothetical protein
MIAEYFRIGLHIDLVEVKSVHRWLDECIHALVQPPFEILDAAFTHDRFRLIDLLQAVPGERNPPWAGKQLLGLLATKLETVRDDELAKVAKTAMDIAKLCDLGDDMYYEFDLLDDSIYLCESGIFGTIEDCREDFKKTFSRYPPPLFGP